MTIRPVFIFIIIISGFFCTTAIAQDNPDTLDYIIIQGRVLNSNTTEPVGDARITFRNSILRVIESREYSEPETGKFYAMLAVPGSYELYANCEGYITLEDKKFDFSAITGPDTMDFDIFLDPVLIGQRIPLDNIYFDFDDYNLKPESLPQIYLVAEFLKENPEIKIGLDGNTDDVGTNEYNQVLSVKRAREVADKLIELGISEERIEIKGYGESRPIASNSTAEGRETNRRVEFVILEN